MLSFRQLIRAGSICPFRIQESSSASFIKTRESGAQKLSEKYGGRVYGSLDELLAEPVIDAVSVCASNQVHAEITIKALEAGKHVLCEKPMATNLEDCRRMLEAAKKTV